MRHLLHSYNPSADKRKRLLLARPPPRAAYSGCNSFVIRDKTRQGGFYYALRRRFLVIALIAAVFGFGGIAAGAVEIAKLLFFVFIVMAVVTFVVGLIRR